MSGEDRDAGDGHGAKPRDDALGHVHGDRYRRPLGRTGHGDEEDSGEPQALARTALVEAARGAQYAIGFENGPGDPKFAVTARRGTSSWKLEVKAKTGHSSQIFRSDVGYGANYELARILDGFRRKLAGEAHLTFNPSLVLGGTAADIDEVLSKGSASGKTNVIAERAVAIGDLRTLSKEQLANPNKNGTRESTRIGDLFPTLEKAKAAAEADYTGRMEAGQ